MITGMSSVNKPCGCTCHDQRSRVPSGTGSNVTVPWMLIRDIWVEDASSSGRLQRLVALIGDQIKHILNRPADEDLAFDVGQPGNSGAVRNTGRSWAKASSTRAVGSGQRGRGAPGCGHRTAITGGVCRGCVVHG